MLKNPEMHKKVSPNDLVGVIFGKEHPGQVKGLSYGACPTFSFQQSTTKISGINFALSSATLPYEEEKFVNIENEVAIVKNQMQTFLPICF